MTSRKFCFTLNNYTPEEEDALAKWYATGKITYMVYGHEVGASGTPHLQGFIYFAKPVRPGCFKKVIKRAHVEKARGTMSDNYKYCTKDGEGIVEYGTKPAQGNRTDLHAFKEAIKAGKSDLQLADDHTNAVVKFPKFVNFVRRAQLEENNKGWQGPLEVLVFWGKAGTGKTRKAYEIDPNLYEVDHTNDRLWFDGYTGQETILFDDFYGGVKHGKMLKLLDGYNTNLAIKGGFTWKAWKRVIITSNDPPEAWYKFGLLPQLERRISKVEHFE